MQEVLFNTLIELHLPYIVSYAKGINHYSYLIFPPKDSMPWGLLGCFDLLNHSECQKARV